jgi:[ribosomal protein S5]-alanine N-acetyltransferase
MLPVISTKRLLLVPFTVADIDGLHALWTEPEVRRFLWDDRVISRERAAEEVQLGLHNEAKLGIGYWTMRSSGGRDLAGFCGFRRIDRGPEIELLYGLRGPEWGRGLASEAARAILDWLWPSTDYQRVFARTDPPNRKSIAVMERLGMRLDSATPHWISYVRERGIQGPPFSPERTMTGQAD